MSDVGVKHDSVEDQCVSVYEKLSRLPSVSTITLANDKEHGNLLHWEINYSERNLARKKNINYKTYGTVNLTNNNVRRFPFPTESNEIITGYSKCGQMKAAVVQTVEQDDVKQYFEIWDNNSKVLTLDVRGEGKHGLVHSNPMFGCIEWSHDNTKILYIADNKPFKKDKQKCSWLDKIKGQGDEATAAKSCCSDKARKDKYLYEDHWGEQMYNCREPTLCILDLEKKQMVNLFEFMPPGISVAKAFWSRDDKYITFTGFSADPWRLGLIYCRNRQSGIYALMLQDKTLKTILDTTDSIYSMLMTPDGSRIFYLQTQSLGPHAQCARLMSISVDHSRFQFGSPTVSCDYVRTPKSDTDFQGIFLREALPTHCWLNNSTLVFQSQNRSHISLFVHDVDTGSVKILETEGEWRLLAVYDNIIFATQSLPNVPQVFKIGTAQEKVKGEWTVDWTNVQQYPENLQDLKWSLLHHTPTFKSQKYSSVPFESVVVMPKDTANLKGLIVNPHGGPHGAFSTGYDLLSACFARLGYAVLRVNYRGSTGFGQDGIDSLIGNIGSLDVADVHQAAQEAINKLNIDPKNIFVKGGSHGGFLTLHLIAQYPDFYKAAVARNPVCNIVANAVASDIPDWSYSEAGLPFSYGVKPEPENYTKMLKMSPVYIADAVKTPLMLMLGGSDKRVPHYQSIEFYRIVKSHNNKVKLLLYEGNDHRIAEVEAETDSFINSALWFDENR